MNLTDSMIKQATDDFGNTVGALLQSLIQVEDRNSTRGRKIRNALRDKHGFYMTEYFKGQNPKEKQGSNGKRSRSNDSKTLKVPRRKPKEPAKTYWTITLIVNGEEYEQTIQNGDTITIELEDE